ncbi:MAG TPA: aldose 1-epimerase family protein, partial [Microvirga sp.]|nr:aldose 1-epimerase family protein [Microvirga sp.]
MGEVISISNGHLQAEIATLGAELVRLRDVDGRDLLWDGDPAVWAGRSPLLFPVVGRLTGGEIIVDGRTYPMPKHGIARTSRFNVDQNDEAGCQCQLVASEATRAHYPFDFSLAVTYRLDGETLRVTASVRNRDSVPMPASFGFHPAFRWPLPYGSSRAAHRIEFEAAEPAPIRRLKDGLLDPVPQATPVQGRVLALSDALFEADALIFDQLASRRLRYGVEGGSSLLVEFPDLPHLGIWTKPGAGFLCIEPWQGYD